MRTMLITDGSLERGALLLEKLKTACQAGIDAIQIREKTSSAKDLFVFASNLRKITWEYGVSLYINERTDLALAVKADGVHLPENAPFSSLAHLKIGRSVHSLHSALSAQKEGVDYVLFGPVFPPLSKAHKESSQGLGKLREITACLRIPVIAVGGVFPENISLLLQNGASGVASITSLLYAQDIKDAVASFHLLFEKEKRKIAGLYGICSSLSIARVAIEGGVDAIQFRHKDPYTLVEMDIARHIQLLCRERKIPFLVNDRADIALELDADGIHLGETDLPIPEARRILGSDKIIGATASTVEQALKREAEGADYIGLGHVFPTSSKQKNYPPIGLTAVRQAKEKLKIPLIAVGGITEHNACSVLAQGADGIACVSAISNSTAIQQLKGLFI